MKNSKLVTLNLDSASFLVTGENDKELIVNAQIAFIKQLSEGNFPRFSYGINEANALSMDTVHAGMIVETSKGEVGIVTATNKKKIDVTFSSGISVAGIPENFLRSDKSFDEARKKRNVNEIKINFWFKGYSGFYKNGNDILEVVIGKTIKGKTLLHIVGTKSFISVLEERVKTNMKDEKSQI